jgi:hypothetical protein
MSEALLEGHTRAEWEAMIARVDETLRAHGPRRIAVTGHASQSTTPPPAPEPDYAAMTTEKLWELHAAIKDGAARTAFFRSYIKSRIPLL